tara:strand:- start:6468 stop:7205 length:738 start_codon:yes stop_codon:yes gene_type:complete
MAKYEKHSTDEGKYQCTISDYGHGKGNGKSRQAVSKHYNALQSDIVADAPIIPQDDLEPNISVDVIEDIIDDETPDTPDWLNFDMSSQDEEQPTISISPTASTILKGMAKGNEPPKSGKAMREYYQQQGKMMGWVFAGVVDPLFTWYGRSITSDTKFEIKRTKKDWDLFEEVSASWLEYHEWNMPITPDIIMAGTIGSFYAPVVMKINRKRDPSKPSFFKRLILRRKMRKQIKQEKEEKSQWNLR